MSLRSRSRGPSAVQPGDGTTTSQIDALRKEEAQIKTQLNDLKRKLANSLDPVHRKAGGRPARQGTSPDAGHRARGTARTRRSVQLLRWRFAVPLRLGLSVCAATPSPDAKLTHCVVVCPLSVTVPACRVALSVKLVVYPKVGSAAKIVFYAPSTLADCLSAVQSALKCAAVKL